jgi:hypothetical protein
MRCTYPNHKDWKNYGGKNPPVIVCERWLKSFDHFLTDMGERPVDATLGRFKDSGNYEPTNCKWMTLAEQRANRKDHKA